jgi:hypothetical protein
MENTIAGDRMLSTINISGADVVDLSFLQQREEERKTKRETECWSTGVMVQSSPNSPSLHHSITPA